MFKFVDEENERTFDREGYVVLEVLDSSQVTAARSIVDEWVHDHVHSASGDSAAAMFDGALYGTVGDPDLARRAEIGTKLAALFSRALEGSLLDWELLESTLLAKGPHASPIATHRHVPLTERPFERTLICWCPLVDCDAGSGTLTVIPRSQHLYRYIQLRDEPCFLRDFEPELTRRYALPIPVRAGSAVFFENSLLHGSTANALGRDRPVVTSGIVRKGAQHAVYRRSVRGGIEAIAGTYEDFQMAMTETGGAYRMSGQLLRTFPDWTRKATFEEVERLLNAGLRATEEFDPLETLCGRTRRKWLRDHRLRSYGHAALRQSRSVISSALPEQAKPLVRKLLGQSARS